MSIKQQAFELVVDAKDNITKKMKDIDDALKSSSNNLRTMSNDVKALNTSMTAMLSLKISEYAFSVASAFVDFTKQNIDAIDKLNDLKDITNINVSELSKLQEVAKAGGVDIDVMTKAFTKLNDKAHHNIETFEKLGINIKDTSNNIMSSEEIFKVVADKIASLESESLKASYATEIFGEKGADLLPILKNGSSAFDEFKIAVEDYNAVVSESLAGQAGDFNDNLQKIEIAFKGISNSVLEDTLPILNAFLNVILDIRKENIADDVNKVTDVFSNLSEILTDAIIDDLRKTINLVEKFFQAMKLGVSTISYVAQQVLLDLSLLKQKFLETVLSRAEASKKIKEIETEKIQLTQDYLSVVEKSLNTPLLTDKFESAYDTQIEKINELNDKTKESDRIKASSAEMSKKLNEISKAQASDISTHYKNQIKAINTLADNASQKTKQALDNQKKSIEEYNLLSLKLNSKNKDINNELSRIKSESNIRKNVSNVYNSRDEQLKSQADNDKLNSLQKEIDLARIKYNEDKSFINESNLRDAEKKLQREQEYLANLDFQTKLNDASQVKSINELDYIAKLQTNRAITSEIRDIQNSIILNKQNDTSSELEIERLKQISSILLQNKQNATGVFDETEFKNLSERLKELNKQINDDAVERAKKEEQDILNRQKTILENLRTQLDTIRFNISDENIRAVANKIVETIDQTLKSKDFAVNVRTNIDNAYTSSTNDATNKVAKFASGGLVKGRGSETSDSISALLSNNEYVLPAAVVKQTDALSILENLRNGTISIADLKTNLDSNTKLNSMITSETVKNFNIALKTENGHINITNDTDQDEIDAFIARTLMRR